MSHLGSSPFFNRTSHRGDVLALDSSAATSFHRNLPGYKVTPLIPLPEIAQELNLKSVFLKDESSRLGLPSFKILGASWGSYCAIISELNLPRDIAIDKLSFEAQKCGVKLFAATDGNHGRAVAYMAKLLSIEADIYVPRTLSEETRRFISDEGAKVVVSSGGYDESVQDAARAAGSIPYGILVQDTAFPGYEQIPAHIVEGYSTIFEEMEEQLNELDLLPDIFVSPVGVGSLAHSVVRHFRASSASRSPTIVTVEPNTAACLYTSLQAGKPVTIQTSHTIMTGLECGTMSSTAWPDLRNHIDVSLSISDEAAHDAVQYLKSQGISTGPCGAAGLAALRYLAGHYREEVGLGADKVVVLLNTEGDRTYELPSGV